MKFQTIYGITLDIKLFIRDWYWNVDNLCILPAVAGCCDHIGRQTCMPTSLYSLLTDRINEDNSILTVPGPHNYDRTATSNCCLSCNTAVHTSVTHLPQNSVSGRSFR